MNPPQKDKNPSQSNKKWLTNEKQSGMIDNKILVR